MWRDVPRAPHALRAESQTHARAGGWSRAACPSAPRLGSHPVCGSLLCSHGATLCSTCNALLSLAPSTVLLCFAGHARALLTSSKATQAPHRSMQTRPQTKQHLVEARVKGRQSKGAPPLPASQKARSCASTAKRFCPLSAAYAERLSPRAACGGLG